MSGDCAGDAAILSELFVDTRSGGTAPASLTPWVTSASDNLKSGGAITVTGGAFTAPLAGRSVTTFVGK